MLLLPAILAFACAFCFAISSIFLKAGNVRGIDSRLVAPGMCVILMLVSLIAAPFVWVSPDWRYIGWPLLAGVFMLATVMTQIIALRMGDVSVQTPLMGSKVILVLLLWALLTRTLPGGDTFVAALLVLTSIVLIGWPIAAALNRKYLWGGMGWTLFSTLLAASLDVLIAYRSQEFGFWPFVILMSLPSGVYGVIELKKKHHFITLSSSAEIFMLVGTLLMAVQVIGMACIIGIFKIPAEVNVIYGSRAFLGWLLPLMLASYLALGENSLPKRVLLRRGIGAVFMVGAIVCVFI